MRDTTGSGGAGLAGDGAAAAGAAAVEGALASCGASADPCELAAIEMQRLMMAVRMVEA